MLQVSTKLYVLTLFNGPTVCVPLAAFVPVQSPDATQVVGLLSTVQVMTDVAPTFCGPSVEAVIVMNGMLAGGLDTAVVAVALPWPAAFAQVRV